MSLLSFFHPIRLLRWWSWLRKPHLRALSPTGTSHTLLQDSPCGMMIVDIRLPDMPISYVNPALERITGYSAEEMLGRNARMLHGHDHDQEGLACLRKALQQQQPCVTLLRNYRKDGTLYWNELSISPVRSAQGQVTHYLGMQVDVTDRIEAQAAITRVNAQYRQMFENNRAMKLLIDPETGKIRDANAAAVDFYGYPRETLLSMRIQDINVLSENELDNVLHTVYRGERSFYEFRHRLASGEVRDVDVFASPLETGEGRFNYAIVIDVGHKREAEQRYRALFEQSIDGVLLLSLSGRILEANPRAAEIFGYSTHELTQMPLKDLVIEAEQQQSRERFARIVLGEKFAPYERNTRHKDGHTVPVELSIEVVYDATRRPMHVQCVVRDITERKVAQENRLQYLMEKARLHMLNQFMQNAAHEFRTPLSVINSKAYLGARIEDPGQRAEHYRQISFEVKRMARLVDMLLLMTRLEGERDDAPTLTPVNVEALLEAAIQHCEVQYPNQCVVQRSFGKDVPVVYATAEYLMEAFHQVLDNAWRYNRPQGVVTVSAYARDGQLVVDVQDNGCGIAREDVPHIFETFWRRDEAHSTPGFGLGLPIAQRIMQRFGGDIVVESSTEQGTCFRMTLPAER